MFTVACKKQRNKMTRLSFNIQSSKFSLCENYKKRNVGMSDPVFCLQCADVAQERSTKEATGGFQPQSRQQSIRLNRWPPLTFTLVIIIISHLPRIDLVNVLVSWRCVVSPPLAPWRTRRRLLCLSWKISVRRN